MGRPDLDVHLTKIDELVSEIETLVPYNGSANIEFRADLAGLLVVAIAATYENCVKEILFEHANRHHNAFGEYCRRNYQKLNSKIRVADLENYCKLYSNNAYTSFKAQLSKRRTGVQIKVGKDIKSSYEQILNWRHDFAHARARSTTIEEAAASHKLGKRVIYVFDQALSNM